MTHKRQLPPQQRSLLGEQFSQHNQSLELILQFCTDCESAQYPSREVCQQCLSDNLQWQACSPQATLLSSVDLQHSESEFFSQKINHTAWPLASVGLADQCLYVHIARFTFDDQSASYKHGTPLLVFAETDSGGQAVLVAVSDETDINNQQQRQAIMQQLGLA